MFARSGSDKSVRQPAARQAPPRAALSGDGDPGSIFDPLQVIAEIWSLRWLVVLLTLLGIGAGVFVALGSPHKYTAITQILVDPRDIKLVQNEVTPNGLPSDATLALIESQIPVIYSNNVLQRVIDKAGLANDPEFNGKSKGLLSPFFALFASEDTPATVRRRQLMTLEALRQDLSVSRDAKSFVINLAVTTFDAEKSAQLANLVADSFIDQLARVESDTAKRASESLSSRLSELRQRVVDAERAVETYKSDKRLVGVGGRLVDDDYIVRINDQLAKARGEMTSLRVRAEQMKNADVDDVVKGTLPEELTSDALGRLRDSYSNLAQQTATLSATLGPRHPRRIAAEDALRSVRDGIRQELARIVSGAQTELVRAEETDRKLSQQVNTLKDKQLSTSSSFVRLRELEREVDASRAVYEAFLLRARETGEQEQMSTANVHIISSATPPLNPSSTSRKLIVIAAAIGGFVLGFGLAGLVALIRLIKRATGRGRPTDLWTDEDPRSTVVDDARDARLASARHDRAVGDAGREELALAAAVRPTVHVQPERVRRSEQASPPRSRDTMAGRVGQAEAALAAAISPQTVAAQPAEAKVASDALMPKSLPPRSMAEREDLREKLRSIAEKSRTGDGGDDDPAYAIYNDDIARLQQDILAVKKNLAQTRNRRHPQGV